MMIHWFRRMPTLDLKGTCLTTAMDSGTSATGHVAVPIRRLQDWSYGVSHRAPPVCCMVRAMSNAQNPHHYQYKSASSMNEDFRSRMKYLKARTDVAMRMVTKPTATAPDERSESDSASLVSEEGEEGMTKEKVNFTNDAISTTMTRSATARVIIRPPVDCRDVKLVKERVQCPKPNALSPYARHSDDSNEEAITLRNHYTKVLLQPHKPFEVVFPIIPNPNRSANTSTLNANAKKGRGLEQYMGNRPPPRSRLMAANVNHKVIGNSSQNRHIQSDTKSEPLKRRSLHAMKNKNDNRSLDLDLCRCESEKCLSTHDLEQNRRKHVEVVRMEVVKLDRKVRSRSKEKGINQELQTVLQEALTQTKAYEKNVTDAQQQEESSDADCPASLLYKRRSIQNPARSCHSVALNKMAGVPQADTFALASPRTRAHSQDGKHCYSVLKKLDEPQKPEPEDPVPQAKPEVDVSMALTDLNAYEDIKVCQREPPEMASKHVRRADQVRSGPTEYVSKLEQDYKLARSQHRQRVLDVMDIVNDIKTK